MKSIVLEEREFPKSMFSPVLKNLKNKGYLQEFFCTDRHFYSLNDFLQLDIVRFAI